MISFGTTSSELCSRICLQHSRRNNTIWHGIYWKLSIQHSLARKWVTYPKYQWIGSLLSLANFSEISLKKYPSTTKIACSKDWQIGLWLSICCTVKPGWGLPYTGCLKKICHSHTLHHQDGTQLVYTDRRHVYENGWQGKFISNCSNMNIFFKYQ